MSGAVILAAGAGRRLGRVAKAALTLPGDRNARTFLEAIRDTASRAGITRSVVIIGPPHDRVTRAEAERLGMPCIHNPDPGRGMASSVALGFAHALRAFDDCSCALLWPVDHPAVACETVRAIIRSLARSREPLTIAIPTLNGRGGHPTGFGRDSWQALASCLNAPEGARSVIHHYRTHHPEQVRRIALADPAIVADVDTPKDLENL